MRSSSKVDRIVIIGGGISGLSSAFYLQKEAERTGRNIHLTIVEKTDVLGGKINTLRKEGFVIEKGPDSFLARKRAMIDLARELGLVGELTETNPLARQSFIMHKRRLYSIPQGMVLGIPTELGPFWKSGLLSFKGKTRAMLDLILPARPAERDETLGGFLERRMGTEVMRRIAEPLLAGIYAGDLKKLSLQATFPQFAQSEKKFGSLMKGMRHNRKQTALAAQEAAKLQKTTSSNGSMVNQAATLPSSGEEAIAKGSTFLTFKGGLMSLVNGLDQALEQVDRKLGTGVMEVRPSQEKGLQAPYEVVLDNGEVLPCDYAVITAQAFHAADMLEKQVDCKELRSINYVSVANVVMAFDKKTFGSPFAGSGFVVPNSEKLHITACTWTSSKWLHTSPDDRVLLRCYVGHSDDQISVMLPDKELIAAVRKDIKDTMGIEAEPLFTEITRLNQSMPQYPVFHLEQMHRFRERLNNKMPGVWITGAAFDGVGLPDCIRQGKEAAQNIMAMKPPSQQRD